MRVYLDLLPEERKENLRSKKIFWLAIRQEILFFLPVIFLVVFLWGLLVVLQEQSDHVDEVYNFESSQKNNMDLKKYDEKFVEVNDKLDSFSDIYRKHLVWTVFLRSFSEIVPEEITLKELATINYQMSLSGKAREREDLLSFKKKLEEDGCYENVNLPLSNLTVKSNVDFQMDFLINKDCLKVKE